MHESQIAQLNRIENQLRDIKRMINKEGYCINILTQIRSASRTLSQIEYNIFKNHLEDCVRKSFSEETLIDRNKRMEEVQVLLAQAR